ncbi:hypothetical protein [Deltalipothrixvirus pozzuoliense]|uniref:Uncharacterized protein ORF107a n=1 Tax=Acidianus filamentous virus 2 (isolate Italy/Pozzuoli) TaxID=654910 RepID=Y107A_AFV2P|nr:hypothetical protein AFV2_gp47 [Acidianus filamentous virus 2]Q573C2.1 RecName: Full=Uncharacterized protein ORF107a [Acidianus filamentous virus 2 (isolate Pozzuoli)]CAH69434.1 hypothetical protein [Acidianus filamentous virus 2]
MSLVIDIADTIVSLTALIGLIITLIKFHSQNKEDAIMQIRKIAQEEIVNFLDTDKFKHSIIDIMNESNVNSKVNDIDSKITQLLAILCYTDSKLKDTELCRSSDRSK